MSASRIACTGSLSPTSVPTWSAGTASATSSARCAASSRASSSAFVSQARRESPEAGARTWTSTSLPYRRPITRPTSRAGTPDAATTRSRLLTGVFFPRPGGCKRFGPHGLACSGPGYFSADHGGRWNPMILWLLLLILLIIAIGGGIVVSKFLFLVLIVALVVVLF